MLLELNVSVSVGFIRVNECFKIKRETLRNFIKSSLMFPFKKIISCNPFINKG